MSAGTETKGLNMAKGRNAAKAFQASRSARFAQARAEAAAKRDAARELLFLPDAEVLDTDEVLAAEGGMSFVRRNRDAKGLD